MWWVLYISIICLYDQWPNIFNKLRLFVVYPHFKDGSIEDNPRLSRQIAGFLDSWVKWIPVTQISWLDRSIFLEKERPNNDWNCPSKKRNYVPQNIKFKTMGSHAVYMFKTGAIIIYYPSYMGFCLFLNQIKAHYPP
jgi:hypothetical protein